MMETIPFSITVEGEIICCDRSELMKKSEYFRAMLESCMVESQTNTVTLHGLKYDIVSTLVEFISTGELRIEEDTIQELTETAVMLMIDEAINTCVAYYSSHLDSSNCFSIMCLSGKLNLPSLYNQARRHALYYFDKVMTQEEFLELNPEDVKNYLSDRHLNCCNEIIILDAILKWYKFDVDGRNQHVISLLDCFHVEDVPTDDQQLVLDHELVKQFAQHRHCGHFDDEDRINKISKKYREVPSMILTIGGCDENSEFCTDINKFHEDEKTFKPCLSLTDVYSKTSTKMGFQATVVGKDLYLSGGQECMTRSSWILSVWKLDGFTLKWERVTELQSPRRHHGACGSEDSLYIMGGFTKFRDILDTVEQYDTFNDCWIKLPRMPFKCYTPSAVFCENKLYVYKTHLICLDVSSLQWTTMKHLNMSTQNGNSISPVYYERFIYEFPYLDKDIDWFHEDVTPELDITRTNVNTGESETVPYNKEVKLGNRCAVFNGRYYTFEHGTNTLMSGSLPDFSSLCKVKDAGRIPTDCFIVVLPHYPLYTLKT